MEWVILLIFFLKKKKSFLLNFDLIQLTLINLFFFDRVCIGLDYKLNFQPGKGDKIDDLHERVAQRILRVCKSNG